VPVCVSKGNGLASRVLLCLSNRNSSVVGNQYDITRKFFPAVGQQTRVVRRISVVYP
jgi:hypothetical protein